MNLLDFFDDLDMMSINDCPIRITSIQVVYHVVLCPFHSLSTTVHITRQQYSEHMVCDVQNGYVNIGIWRSTEWKFQTNGIYFMHFLSVIIIIFMSTVCISIKQSMDQNTKWNSFIKHLFFLFYKHTYWKVRSSRAIRNALLKRRRSVEESLHLQHGKCKNRRHLILQNTIEITKKMKCRH